MGAPNLSMGKEAICVVHLDGKSYRCKAHLDSETLRLTGGLRLNFPLRDLSQARARSGTLQLQTQIGPFELEVGAGAAESWAAAIRHPKSLIEKLGVRPADRVCVIDVDDDRFLAELTALLGRAPSNARADLCDAVFLGLRNEPALADIERHKSWLAPAGALWLVYPKGKGSPVREAAVRGAIVAAGLVDVKVAAFSTTHTAVKAVIPLSARKRP